MSQIDAQMNLEELFHRYPLVTSEFIERRMHCVGCPLARFETIADACRIYRQPVDDLLAALTSIIETTARPPDTSSPGPTGARGKLN